MYRSEALQNLYQAQDAVRFAQHALEYAQELLQDSECDHPDTDGLQCSYCGVFHLPEGQLQADDDFRKSGLPNLAPYNSLYAY